MATVLDYLPVTDGTALSAALVNALAAGLPQLIINGLSTDYVERYAMDAQHLPTQSYRDVFSSGYEVTSTTTTIGDNLSWYANTLPLSTGGTAYPYTYQTMDPNSGTTGSGGFNSIAIYGSTGDESGGTVHLDSGWRIPAKNQTTVNAMELPLNAATNLDTVGIRGIICRGSIGVTYMRQGASSISGTTAYNYLGTPSAAIAIGFIDGLGAYHIIERSVRFYSGGTCIRGNISAFTFLTQDDLDTLGNGEVTDIFCCLATVRPHDIRAAAAGTGAGNTRDNQDDVISIERYNLSVLPVRAGSL
jgi:hypothetical protein